MKNKTTILIWTDENTKQIKNALPLAKVDAITTVAGAQPEHLAQRFKEFITAFETVLQECPENVGNFSIDQLELNLTVNANGEIGLIGKISSGIATSIKVTLKRK
jgi:hypothetical protein